MGWRSSSGPAPIFKEVVEALARWRPILTSDLIIFSISTFPAETERFLLWVEFGLFFSLRLTTSAIASKRGMQIVAGRPSDSASEPQPLSPSTNSGVVAESRLESPTVCCSSALHFPEDLAVAVAPAPPDCKCSCCSVSSCGLSCGCPCSTAGHRVTVVGEARGGGVSLLTTDLRSFVCPPSLLPSASLAVVFAALVLWAVEPSEQKAFAGVYVWGCRRLDRGKCAAHSSASRLERGGGSERKCSAGEEDADEARLYTAIAGTHCSSTRRSALRKLEWLRAVAERHPDGVAFPLSRRLRRPR